MKNFKKKTFLLLTMSSVIGSTMTASAGWVHFKTPPFESGPANYYRYFTDDFTMLVNTTTPDGRIVDANGRLVGSADGLNYIESSEHIQNLAKYEGGRVSDLYEDSKPESISDKYGTDRPTKEQVVQYIKDELDIPDYIIDICTEDLNDAGTTVGMKTLENGVTVYSSLDTFRGVNHYDIIGMIRYATDANGNPYSGPIGDNQYYFENGRPASGVKLGTTGYYYYYVKGVRDSRKSWFKTDGKIYHSTWININTPTYIDPYEWSYGGYPMQLNSDASLNNIAGVHDVSVNSSEMSSEVQQAIKNSIENINTRSEDKGVYTIIDQLNKPFIKFDGIPFSSGWTKGFEDFTRFARHLSFNEANNLTSIDVSKHYGLETLSLENTLVTSLDCTNNINLSNIYVLGSTGLTSIKLSACGAPVWITLPSTQSVARDMATGQIYVPYSYPDGSTFGNGNVLLVNAVGQTIVIS